MNQLIPAYIQQQLAIGTRKQKEQLPKASSVFDEVWEGTVCRSSAFLKGFALNIDLSGFTKLTEDLMHEGKAGAETLSLVLNEIFEPLVALVYVHGGFIPYFAGDAFTAIFPFPQDSRHATHVLFVAQEAQRIFRDRNYRFGSNYTIGIKVGMACGEVEHGIVGKQKKAFFFRGLAIGRAAECQSRAAEGEIVIDQGAKALLRPAPSAQFEEIAPHCYLLSGYFSAAPISLPPFSQPDIDPAIAADFLPEAIINNEHPGEFRTVVTLFIAFDQLRTYQELDDFAQIVLLETHNFGGFFKEIDFGDKGGLMAVFFGAPVSYENNMARALELALLIQEKSEALRLRYPAFCFRIGISAGTAFTGIVGGKERCQYACVGNRVNLAVRIMSSAAWNEIMCDDALALANPAFRFSPKGATHYKGISEPVPVFKLLGRRLQEGKPSYAGYMVARNKELAMADTFLADPQGVLYIYGEAGIGKSRFTHELRSKLEQQQTIKWLLCPCDQILRKPFNPFLYCLRQYFRQSSDNSPSYNLALFEEVFGLLQNRLAAAANSEADQYTKELRRTKPIIAALLGLVYEDGLWEQLDARGRYQNTIAAIINILQAENHLQPLVLELEDIHWLEEDSRVLLQALFRQMEDKPLLIIATARPFDDGELPVLASDEVIKDTQIASLALRLEALAKADVEAFAQQQLAGPIHPSFLEMLLKTSNSNPFYIEQLIAYFKENKLLINDHGAWNLKDENIQLSNSITAILTARIDRLSELVKETVKAAAVIGREFDLPVLTEVLCQGSVFRKAKRNTPSLLKEQVALAEQGQIWSAVNELRYIFRHSLMREAAYSMQLTTQLQQLHAQIAGAIEKIYAQSLGEHYIDLVFHHEQAGNAEKTISYLHKAADYARANFQNQQALDFYDRLLAKLAPEKEGTDTLKILLRKANVLELVGQWETAQQTYEQAQDLAKKSKDIILLGRANSQLGNVLTLRGRYDEAMQYLQIAASLFDSIDDMMGLAKVNSYLGNLFFRRARYDDAERYYKKALEAGIGESGTTSSAQTLSFLGLTYMNKGQYDTAIALILKQIPLHEDNNNHMGLASLHTNLGIVYFESGQYMAAKVHYEKGLELAERLGNKQLAAIGIGCLGTVLEKQGHYEQAMRLYEQDLKVCKELGDWQGISIAEGLLGELQGIMGNFDEATPHLKQSLRISKELGYKKGVAKAINALGDVHYWQTDYPAALDYYQQAIDVARKTNNRLVLGSSLMEKGLVLLEMQDLPHLFATAQEASEIAQALGNPDLLADTQILQARILAKQQDFRAAITLLQELLANANLTADQEAAAYFERFRISEKDTEARDLARALYEQLFTESPKYVFKIRLQKLRKKAN